MAKIHQSTELVRRLRVLFGGELTNFWHCSIVRPMKSFSKSRFLSDLAGCHDALEAKSARFHL